MLSSFFDYRCKTPGQRALIAFANRSYLGIRAADLGQLDHQLLVDWLKRSACFLLRRRQRSRYRLPLLAYVMRPTLSLVMLAGVLR